MSRAAVKTELELRVEFARRRDETHQAQARALCAVDSESCRAGDEWEWFDLTEGPRTYCFCPAHALAAELGARAGGYFSNGMTGAELVAKIQGLEQDRDRQRAG